MSRDILVLLLVLVYSSVINCSIIIQTVDSCEVRLSNGFYEKLNASIQDFHECVPPLSNKNLRVVLENFSLPAFPNNSFSYFGSLPRLELVIEGHSKIQHLLPPLPGFSLFKSSWFDSAFISIQDLLTLDGWQWIHLAELSVSRNGGLNFNAVRSKLVFLNSDFGKIAGGNVIAVRILKCQLRWLGKRVFAPFQYLKTLELRDNLLETIERSHLPVRAPDLKALDLGNNRLKILPQDFVKGLNLEKVFLGGNNLKIPAHQVQLILNTGEYPLLFGVLWPCTCKKSTKTSLEFSATYRMQNCYKKSDTGKPLDYDEECS